MIILDTLMINLLNIYTSMIVLEIFNLNDKKIYLTLILDIILNGVPFITIIIILLYFLHKKISTKLSSNVWINLALSIIYYFLFGIILYSIYNKFDQSIINLLLNNLLINILLNYLVLKMMKSSYNWLGDRVKNKKYLKFLTIRILLSIILFLTISIFVNSSNKNLLIYKKYCYDKNLNYSKFTSIYNKYFGKVLPEAKQISVSKGVIEYSEVNSYKDGAVLKTNSAIYPYKSGIVVFVGEKEDYDDTIIIQGMDGIDYWYSNVTDINVKLYDYVETSDIIANPKEDKLYVLFSKDGNFLNYEDYI